MGTHHGGELAVQFGFNRQGELQVEGYLEPLTNGEFLADELRMAYLLGSLDSLELEEDEVAVQLLQEFAGTFIKKQKEKHTYEVYTLNEQFPVRLGFDSTNKNQKETGRNTKEHTVGTGAECYMCFCNDPSLEQVEKLDSSGTLQRTGSMKQSDEPESIRAQKSDWICGDRKMGNKDFGSEKAEALSCKKDST
jgi:hypothetical protein